MEFIISIPFAEKTNGRRRVWQEIVDVTDEGEAMGVANEFYAHAPRILEGSLLERDPDRPRGTVELGGLFDIGKPMVSMLGTGEVEQDRRRRLALNSLMLDPLGPTFTCAGCSTECKAVQDQFGVYRNAHEMKAVLWFAPDPGRRVISRIDFCSPECLARSRPATGEAGKVRS